MADMGPSIGSNGGERRGLDVSGWTSENAVGVLTTISQGTRSKSILGDSAYMSRFLFLPRIGIPACLRSRRTA
jgi:hypothetical protein